LREHEALCDTLATGNSDAAEAAMKEHIRSAAKRYGVDL
jgi:DNA-binding GntR family transcriptional regulator